MRYMLCVALALTLGSELPAQDTEILLPVAEEFRRLTNAVETKNWGLGEDAAEKILKQFEKKPQLLEIHKDIHADIRYYYGLCLLNQGKLKEASHQFNEAIRLDENFLDAYIGLALVFNKENNIPQTKKQIERAVSRGFPVREVQKIPELCKYLLESLNFFTRLIELEQEFTVKADPEHDPFRCPLRRRKVGGTPPVAERDIMKVPDQLFRLQQFRDILANLRSSIEAGLDPTDIFEKAEEHYNRYIRRMDGKRREEMERLWVEAKREHKEAIERIRKEKLLREIKALLNGLNEAYKRRSVSEGEEVYRKMIKQFEEAVEFKNDTDFWKKVEMMRKIADVLHTNLLIIKEFAEKILPKIRFCGVIEKPDAKILVILEVPTADGGVVSEALEEGEGIPGFGDEVRKVLKVGKFNRWLDELTLIYKNVPLKLQLETATGKASLTPEEDEDEKMR